MSAKEYINQALKGNLQGKDVYNPNPKKKSFLELRSGASTLNVKMHQHLRPKLPEANQLGGGREFKALERSFKDLTFAGKHREAVEFVKKAANDLGVDFNLLKEYFEADDNQKTQMLEAFDFFRAKESNERFSPGQRVFDSYSGKSFHVKDYDHHSDTYVLKPLDGGSNTLTQHHAGIRLEESLTESLVHSMVEWKGQIGSVISHNLETGYIKVAYPTGNGAPPVIKKQRVSEVKRISQQTPPIQESKMKKTIKQLMSERIDSVAPTEVSGHTYHRELELHDHPVAPESQFTGGLPHDHMVANVVDHIIDRETQANLEQRYGPQWRLIATDIVAHLAKLQPNRRPDVHESIAAEMGGFSIMTENLNPASISQVYNSVREAGGSHVHAVAAIRPMMPMGTVDTNFETRLKEEHEKTKSIPGEYRVVGESMKRITEDLGLGLGLAAGLALVGGTVHLADKLKQSIRNDTYPASPPELKPLTLDKKMMKKSYSVPERYHDSFRTVLESARNDGTVGNYSIANDIIDIEAPDFIHKEIEDRFMSIYGGK